MAKLVDMLVDAGLNKGFEWPDGFDYCAQDTTDDMLVFCNEEMEHTFWDGAFLWTSLTGGSYDEIIMFSELADDYQTAQITKQEYLNALEKAKGLNSSATEGDDSAGVISADVCLKPQQTVSHGPLENMPPHWMLPTLLTRYSREKESFGLLEKELNVKREELYNLQEDIRLLCEQQGWKIEPLGL